jgi:hypothetical protein
MTADGVEFDGRIEFGGGGSPAAIDRRYRDDD